MGRLLNHYFKLLSFLTICIITIPVTGQRIINIGVQASYGYSSIKTSFSENITNAQSQGGFNINYGVTAQYFLNKKYGVASGIEIMGFDQNSSGTEYYESFNEIDSENQIYERRIWGDDISEKATLKILHIPMHVFYRHTFNTVFSIYGSIGPGISIPLFGGYKGNGIFTYKGYYPQDKVLLYDIPVYGFNSDVNVNVNDKVDTNPIIICMSSSLGVSVSFNRYYNFYTSIGYFRTITNAAKNVKSYHISNQIGTFNSLLNSGKNSLSNAWISIGFSKNFLF